MPIGFPSDASVTIVDGIEPLPSDIPPLADAIRQLDSMTRNASATDFGITYKYCVKDDERGNFLYGDVHTAKCRVRDAYNRCLTEKHGISEYQVDGPLHEQYEANHEQVAGYLEYAIEFLDRGLDRLDTPTDDSDCTEFINTVEDVKSILRQHHDAATRGTVYAGPPVDSIL